MTISTVFDGEQVVERVFRLNATGEAWWWGVSFDLTGRKSYGNTESLDEAKTMFRVEYESWLKGG
jgi:hypothetical protein